MRARLRQLPIVRRPEDSPIQKFQQGQWQKLILRDEQIEIQEKYQNRKNGV
jgi:hypothetical protein